MERDSKNKSFFTLIEEIWEEIEVQLYGILGAIFFFIVIYFSMERDIRNKSFFIWIEEIWEEIEVQFYGISGAIIFFVVIYFIFKPVWMRTLLDLVLKK